MAAESIRLAEAHRLAQHRIGAETVRLSTALFPLLQLSNIDGSSRRWLQAMTPVVLAQHRRSTRLAADYATAARRLDLGVDPGWRPMLAAPSAERVATSLWVTGPARVRALSANGVGLATVRRTVQATTSRSAMRLALAGGRDTLVDTVTADPRPAWWARVTSDRPCAFCAMLASRGPVYKSQTSASFAAHDGCSCAVMVTYNRLDGWTEQAAEFRKLWEDTTSGLSGRDAVNAFRQAIETPAAALPLAA